MQTITPVKNTERERLMDILRGFAILGIFIANLNFLSLYNNEKVIGTWHYPFDNKMRFFHALFIEGKFYSIFSLLFGWGVALQLQRGKNINIDPVVTVKRRLRGMLLLGMLHILLLWTGDIVAFYAMLGFLLLLFRNMNDKKLLIWGITLILSPVVIYFLKMKFLWLNAPAGILYGAGEWIDKKINHVLPDGPALSPSSTATWISIWKLNLAGFFFRYGYLFFVSRISKVLGMFLIGYMVGRNGNYKKILENKKLLIKIALLGFLIGLPANYFLAGYMENPDDYFNLKMNGFYETVAYALGVVPLAMAYTASIGLAYKTSIGKKMLSVLQPVGKMAFTNYIMHSLIGIITFYGIGFGLGGQVGPSAWTVFALIVFTIQIMLSHLWLSFFNFGPLEWLWRSMTYKKWQPMRKR